jgi:hypothetical protein
VFWREKHVFPQRSYMHPGRAIGIREPQPVVGAAPMCYCDGWRARAGHTWCTQDKPPVTGWLRAGPGPQPARLPRCPPPRVDAASAPARLRARAPVRERDVTCVVWPLPRHRVGPAWSFVFVFFCTNISIFYFYHSSYFLKIHIVFIISWLVLLLDIF